MRRAAVLPLVVAAFVLGLSPARAEDRVEERPYRFGALGDLAMSCDGAYGGTCFEVNRDERWAHFRIADASGEPVGARIEFRYVQADYGFGIRFMSSTRPDEHICGSIERAWIPPETTHLLIRLDGPLNAETGCGPGAAWATEGSITGCFRPWEEYLDPCPANGPDP